MCLQVPSEMTWNKISRVIAPLYSNPGLNGLHESITLHSDLSKTCCCERDGVIIMSSNKKKNSKMRAEREDGRYKSSVSHNGVKRGRYYMLASMFTHTQTLIHIQCSNLRWQFLKPATDELKVSRNR